MAYKNYYNLDKIANLGKYTTTTNNHRDPPYAFVTFLADDSDNVKGVIGLAKGLRKVNSDFPLVVAVLPAVPFQHRQVLTDQGCLVRQIHPLAPPLTPTATYYYPFAPPSRFFTPSFALNYSKLRLWEFVEYKKIIYMDAKTQVFDNIDHLFRLPDGLFHGVVDCLCDIHCPPCPKRIRWPIQLGSEPCIYLNCGMFVFEPNLDIYNAMLNTLQITPITHFAEQDFLNMFFRNKSNPILPVYNCLVDMIWRHPSLVKLKSAKVVNYCAPGSEPWRYTGKEENMGGQEIETLVDMWWNVYNDDDYDFVSDSSLGSLCGSSSSA